jgi:hypothetical protein
VSAAARTLQPSAQWPAGTTQRQRGTPSSRGAAGHSLNRRQRFNRIYGD